MKRPNRLRLAAAFSLAEIAVASSLVSIVAAAGYSLFNSSVRIYAGAFSVNQSHLRTRDSIDKLRLAMYGSAGRTRLIDVTGAPLAGTGPAAGISFERVVSGPYPLTAPAGATATTIDIQYREPVPAVGDVLAVGNPVVRAPITAVTVNGTGPSGSIRLSFAAAFGQYASPKISTGTVVPQGIPTSIVKSAQCLAMSRADGEIELRYYANGPGQPHEVLAILDGGQAFNSTPFKLTGPAGEEYALIEIAVRVPDYSNQVKDFHQYFKTSTALLSK